MEEIEGQRQKGTDREEETERRGGGEEAYLGTLASILKFTLLLYCTQVVTHADHANGLPWLVQILLLIKVPNSRNYKLH